MEDVKGYVREVFRSLQGEGPYTGEMHAFVRLAGCTLGCAYCDTGGALVRSSRARFLDAEGTVSEAENPLDAGDVIRRIAALDSPSGVLGAVAVTGGEPLEQAGFTAALGKAIKASGYRSLLETNGAHPDGMRHAAEQFDIVSMDIKLPSATGLMPMWDLHEAFLARCWASSEVYVKAVVSELTPDVEVERAARVVNLACPDALLVIQPMSGPGGLPTVSGGRLVEMYLAAYAYHRRVRVMPQAHGVMGVM